MQRLSFNALSKRHGLSRDETKYSYMLFTMLFLLYALMSLLRFPLMQGTSRLKVES